MLAAQLLHDLRGKHAGGECSSGNINGRQKGPRGVIKSRAVCTSQYIKCCQVQVSYYFESDRMIDIAETFVVRFDKNCDCMEYFT